MLDWKCLPMFSSTWRPVYTISSAYQHGSMLGARWITKTNFLWRKVMWRCMYYFCNCFNTLIQDIAVPCVLVYMIALCSGGLTSFTWKALQTWLHIHHSHEWHWNAPYNSRTQEAWCCEPVCSQHRTGYGVNRLLHCSSKPIYEDQRVTSNDTLCWLPVPLPCPVAVDPFQWWLLECIWCLKGACHAFQASFW